MTTATEFLDKLRAMSFEEFSKFVNRDTRNNTAAIEAAALRDPSMRTKWRLVLGQLKTEIENQIEAKEAELESQRDDPDFYDLKLEYERWHASAVRVLAGLDEKIGECEFLTLSETTE